MQTRDELIASIFEAMSAMKRGMHGRMQTLIGDVPISRSQLELIFILKQLQPVSAKQLAAHMQLTPGAISQLIDGLMEQDFITRETDAADRRLQILRVSKHGMTAIRRIEKHRHEMFVGFMKDLTTAELELLLQINQKIAAQLSISTKSNAHKETK